MSEIHESRLRNTSNVRALGVGAIGMIAALLLGISAQGAVPFEFSNAGAPPAKPGTGYLVPASPRVADLVGDNATNAIVIPSLPFSASGNTCGFTDDYVVSCAVGASTAPDVVYRVTPTSTMCVNISICQSDYDAALYVWQGTVGNVIACNDDACGPTGQQSRIAGLTLQAGVTYYIVVDGFGTQPPGSVGCGNYLLDITQCPASCTPLPCPTGAIPEDEASCFTGYVDSFNGGCNSTPAVFTNISCPATICGTYGKYCSDAFFCFNVYRDTDWYRLQVTTPMTLHVCVQGEIPTQVALLDAANGCNYLPLGNSQGLPLGCETFCSDVPVGPGTYYVFVAPQQDPTFPPCSSKYVLSVSSTVCSATPARMRTWGNLKAIYR